MMVLQDSAYDKNKPCVLYQNVFEEGTLTATSGTAENAVSGTTWDFWIGTGSSTLTVDMGVDTEVDCFFIDAHDLFAVGSTLTVQAYIAAAWVTIETITPTDNAAIMVITPNITATQFRVTAIGVSIGVVMAGKRLVFPNGVDPSHTSIAHARTYELLSGDSISGQFTNSMVVRKGASLGVTFPLLNAEWVDSEMKEFETHYNVGKPFAWAASPSRFPDDMGFCKRPSGAGELRPMYYEGGMYEEFTMDLGVYINE